MFNTTAEALMRELDSWYCMKKQSMQSAYALSNIFHLIILNTTLACSINSRTSRTFNITLLESVEFMGPNFKAQLPFLHPHLQQHSPSCRGQSTDLRWREESLGKRSVAPSSPQHTHRPPRAMFCYLSLGAPTH